MPSPPPPSSHADSACTLLVFTHSRPFRSVPFSSPAVPRTPSRWCRGHVSSSPPIGARSSRCSSSSCQSCSRLLIFHVHSYRANRTARRGPPTSLLLFCFVIAPLTHHSDCTTLLLFFDSLLFSSHLFYSSIVLSQRAHSSSLHSRLLLCAVLLECPAAAAAAAD